VLLLVAAVEKVQPWLPIHSRIPATDLPVQVSGSSSRSMCDGSGELGQPYAEAKRANGDVPTMACLVLHCAPTPGPYHAIPTAARRHYARPPDPCLRLSSGGADCVPGSAVGLSVHRASAWADACPDLSVNEDSNTALNALPEICGSAIQ